MYLFIYFFLQYYCLLWRRFIVLFIYEYVHETPTRTLKEFGSFKDGIRFFSTIILDLDQFVKGMKMRARSSCSQIFFKIDALKNFEIFTGKHLCWSLFFNKVVGLRSENTFFYRTLPMAASGEQRTLVLCSLAVFLTFKPA